MVERLFWDNRTVGSIFIFIFLSYWLFKMSNPDISSNESTAPITPVPVSIPSPTIPSNRSGSSYTHKEFMSVFQSGNDIPPIGTNE